jgi:uncharacterized membrane protein YeiH
MLRHTMIDTFKTMVVAACSALIAYFEPIDRFIFVTMLLYFTNLGVGVVADIYLTRTPPSIVKFWKSVKELATYLGVIFLVFTVSEKMDFDDGAIYIVKALMCLVIYFYTVNILKNGRRTNPKNKFIKVLYMLMTIDFLEKFAPWAKKYINE